jgi:dipeptidyl-peptidase 4
MKLTFAGLFLAIAVVAAGARAQSVQERIARAEEWLPDRIDALAPDIAAHDRVDVQWESGDAALHYTDVDGRRWRLELPSGKRSETAVRAGSSAEPVGARSADGRSFVFAAGHDLLVRDAAGERRLTFDGELWRSFNPRFSRSNPSERPMPTGDPPRLFFIGASSWLVAERWDFRKVRALWMIDSLRGPRLIEQKYALPADAEIPVPELWLIDAASGERRLLENSGWAYLGDMDVGAGGIAGDDRYVYFTRMSRGYETVELCRAAVPSGAVEVIRRERGEPYFTIRHPEIVPVPGGRELIWKSDRDGFRHYYLLRNAPAPAGDREIRQLTKGRITADRVLHVAADERMVYFTAFGDGADGDPNYRHFYRVSLDGGVVQRLDQEEATRQIQASPRGKYFVERLSAVNRPDETRVRDRRGRVVATLATTRTDSLAARGWKAPERFRVRAEDGITDLYGTMWRPFPFDATKRYPVVLNAYPGPDHDSVPTEFDPGDPNTSLAQLGFIVISPGVRGSSSIRGREFQLYVRRFGNMRDYGTADLKFITEALARSRPWMNLDRVGIVGRSGGGFFSMAAMLATPEFYKAGVSGSGNHDNNLYEMNSGAVFFGPPPYPTNMEAVSRLNGALLLIHGDQDEDVPLSQTYRLVDALIHADKPFDLLVLPGQPHTYRYEDPVADAYPRRRTWRHLLEHLAD